MNPYEINLHFHRVTQAPERDIDEYYFTKVNLYNRIFEWVNENGSIPESEEAMLKKKYIVFIENEPKTHWRLIIVCYHYNIQECRDFLVSLDKDDKNKEWKKAYPMIFIFDGLESGRVYEKKIKRYIYKYLEMLHARYKKVDENSNPFCIKHFESELDEQSEVMPIIFPSNSK